MFKEKQTRWSRLDNAAKIFPATSGKKDARVFRFACELTEEVDANILQQALEETIEYFPFFRSVLRKGLFWYYFESSDLKPVVKEEYKLPCSNLFIRDKKSLLFEVTYYKRRINLEVYHALTDGTGALQFLKRLVYCYLRKLHPEKVTEDEEGLGYDATNSEKQDDSFQKYYEKGKKAHDIPKYKSYQLQGIKCDYGHMKIIEGVVSAKELLVKARQHNTTITVFLTAIYLCSIEKEMSLRQRKKPIALMVPVNLRNFFPSESARNFFGWIDVGYNFSTQSNQFDDIVSYLSEFFRKEITSERMAMRMNHFIGLEVNPFLRIAPLELKILFLQLGARMSSSSDTAIFSNIGKITMPKQCEPYIRLFDVFTSTPKVELCMCSFQDNLVLSFTSAFESTNIERNFFRMLTSMGLEVEIASKQYRKDL